MHPALCGVLFFCTFLPSPFAIHFSAPIIPPLQIAQLNYYMIDKVIILLMIQLTAKQLRPLCTDGRVITPVMHG